MEGKPFVRISLTKSCFRLLVKDEPWTGLRSAETLTVSLGFRSHLKKSGYYFCLGGVPFYKSSCRLHFYLLVCLVGLSSLEETIGYISWDDDVICWDSSVEGKPLVRVYPWPNPAVGFLQRMQPKLDWGLLENLKIFGVTWRTQHIIFFREKFLYKNHHVVYIFFYLFGRLECLLWKRTFLDMVMMSKDFWFNYLMWYAEISL